MTQQVFGNLTSPLHGSTLINTVLSNLRDSLLTQHAGNSRPEYAVAKLIWVDDTTNPWVIHMFDGTDDVVLGHVDATEHTFQPAGTGIPDDSIGTAKLGDDITGNSKTFLQTADAAAKRTAIGAPAVGAGNTFSGAQKGTPVALTQAATIAVDLSLANMFYTTMTGNRTLGAPSNAAAGQSGQIEITQDATGGRTLAFNAAWLFAGGVDPVLSVAPNAKDILFYTVGNGGVVYASLSRAFA